PREGSYDPLAGRDISENKVANLSAAAQNCWSAITRFDVTDLGAAVRASFEAQVDLFPSMLTDKANAAIEKYRRQAFGWKLTGARGGGYLLLIPEPRIGESIRIRRAPVQVPAGA